MLSSLTFRYPDKTLTFWPWLLYQPVGWLVRLAEMAARVRHDIVSRTLSDKITISQTNEMVVPRAYIQRSDGQWIVDIHSKITMQLVKFVAWMNYMASLLGPSIWPRFQNKGAGWMDFPPPNEKKSFNMLTTGGNLVRVLGFIGIHALIETQDIQGVPDPKKTYEAAPQDNVKQVEVGHNRNKETYWIADQSDGDVIIPLMTDVQATLPINALEFLPQDFPFETVIWGRMKVTIYRVVFQGSDTWADIGEGRWVCIEKMEVTGLGTWRDRRLAIRASDWFSTCPPPVKGWTKGKVA